MLKMKIEIPKTEAIAFAGNGRKLADMLNISKQSVSAWGNYLPQSSAQKLYILTNGSIGLKIDETET